MPLYEPYSLVTREIDPFKSSSDGNDEFGDGETGHIIKDKQQFIDLVDVKKTIYLEILDKASNETQILSIPDVPMLKLHRQHFY